MNILALEPYFSGSHKAFLEEWINHSKHDWTVLSLPGFKWKWRMRHAPITFSKMIEQEVSEGGKWDLVFCSSMLSIHELIGLMPACAKMPVVMYFHENQLTYPLKNGLKRDYQYAYSQLLSASIASEVWFNSEYHKNEFLSESKKFLSRMPDYNDAELVSKIDEKSTVQYPGIEHAAISENSSSDKHPLHIVWAARWEFDKKPEVLYEALLKIKQSGKQFCLSILGEQFEDSPVVFEKLKSEFSEEIKHFGFSSSKQLYLSILNQSDVFVSTAIHEFFGLSCVEAMSQGCFPLVPKCLAYPETVGKLDEEDHDKAFYDGSSVELANMLSELIDIHDKNPSFFKQKKKRTSVAMECFLWENRAKSMDDQLDAFQ